MKNIVVALTLVSCSTFATESNFDQMYLRGTFNNWDTNTEMALVADHVWETQLSVSEDNTLLKFDVNGDWSQNFGDNNADEIADLNGADINIADAGTYRVQFNDETKKYAVMLPVAIYFNFDVPSFYITGGLPLTIEQDGDFYANDEIDYSSSHGNWLNTYLPLGHEYTVNLDAVASGNYGDAEADRYQGSATFVVSQPMLSQQTVNVAVLATKHNAVSFEARAFLPKGCWLELRGNKLPLTWSEGTALTMLGSWQGTADSHLTANIVMQEEGEFEYKYTRVCTGSSIEWAQGANLVGPTTGVDAPRF